MCSPFQQAARHQAARKVQRRRISTPLPRKAVLDSHGSGRAKSTFRWSMLSRRRALEYLVGFNLSPSPLAQVPGDAFGRTLQSVALRLVCDRESEIERFITEEYWNLPPC